MAEQECPLVGFASGRPSIVITNDDGVGSPALVPLRRALMSFGDVSIVVPSENRSGAARSITRHTSLWVEEVGLEDGSLALSVDGTPVDCVRMSALGLLERPPDLIVSGVNLGENMGDDITYSGTVAAAFEGIMLGIPALSVSAQGYHSGYDLDVPARVTRHLVDTVMRRGFPAKTLLNVNCPDRPWEGLSGARLTTLGKRVYGDQVQHQETRDGRRRYLVYNDELGYHEEPGTDFEATASGYVSITPLEFDLMSHRTLDHLRCWEPDLDLGNGAGAREV
jgi:5'-nucleotidase